MSKRMIRSNLRKNLRLGVEALEDRRLLAGNITATFFGGNLVLRGDASDNAVTISQTAPNTVSVLGKTNSGSATTINGLAGPITFTGVLNSVDADLKAGNDQFLLGNNSTDVNALNNEILFGSVGTFSGLASARTVVKFGVVARMGDGIDSVVIFADVGGDIFVDGGANNDGFGVQGSIVRGSVTFEGGTGDNPSLLVRNTIVSNQININGGQGANRANVSSSTAQNVNFHGNEGADLITVSNSNIKNNVSVNSFGGADSLLIGGSTIGGSAYLDVGSADDSVSIDNTSIRFDAIITGWIGNDSFAITSKKATPGSGALATQTTIGGVLVVDAGQGNDTIDIGSTGTGDLAVKVTGYTTIIGGDGLDGLTVRNSQFLNGFTADMGAGNDSVDFKGVAITRNLSVFLGSGDDSLRLDSTSAAFADLYGGLGRDGSKLTGNSLGRITQREFETTIV